MPVAIILCENTAPAILERDTPEDLFSAVCELATVPDAAKADLVALVDWIESRPLPSGWFESSAAADHFAKQAQIRTDAQLLRAAIKSLAVSQSQLTAMIGLADKNRDGHPVRRIMNGKQGLTGAARRALAYALEHGPMTPVEEARILNRVSNGAWRQVDRDSLPA